MNSFKNNDPFKQFVKSKLADYKQEVPPSGWEDLESSLFAAKKTKVIHKKWLISTMTAVAAALFGVFFIFNDMNNELPTNTADTYTTPITPPHSTPINEDKEDKTQITNQNLTKDEKSSTELFADNASLAQQRAITTSRSNTSKDTSIIVPSKDSEKKVDFAPNTVNEDKTGNKDKSSELNEEKKQQMLQDFINDGKQFFAEVDDTKTAKRKNSSKFAVSLAGRSAFASSQQSSKLPTTLRSSLSDTYGDFTMSKMQAYTEDENVNPESEITHRQPVSFGLLTSFNITKKLQIETGLVYTFLSSETKNTSADFNNTEKQQFHYLGIPVNLNYTLLSVNRLNLFVTAGAMIEKDINGKIKYNDEKTIPSIINSGYANETSSKINQKNPQLSVATGVGVTYPIYDKACLFGKIGGRYYINANNEFKTYYSDEKFGLDIQLGVKFNF